MLYAYIVDIVESIEEEEPPRLNDLTNLQIAANQRYGLSAADTLSSAQNLYEEQLISYPRSGSQFISTDMAQTVAALVTCSAGLGSSNGGGSSRSSALNIQQVINNDGVTDHTAILPTRRREDLDLEKIDLSPNEKRILDMIYQNLYEATAGPYRYQKTVVTISCGGVEFKETGIKNLDLGWKQFDPDQAKEHLLPDFKIGERVAIEDVSLAEGQSSPPAHYTDGTLLHAMETAGGGGISNEKQHSGIGTVATRAEIIEKLIHNGFIERVEEKDENANKLVPTQLGKFLCSILPDSLKSADMTVDWEEKLLAVENGSLEPDLFLTQISDFVKTTIQDAINACGSSKNQGPIEHNNASNFTLFTPVQFEGTVKVQGETRNVSRKVYQRHDIDFTYFDENAGMTNLERMQIGRPPIGSDGNPIQLHHVIQKEAGPMVEIREITHQEYYRILHGFVESGASFRNDSLLNKQYNNFRVAYWKWRASQLTDTKGE